MDSQSGGGWGETEMESKNEVVLNGWECLVHKSLIVREQANALRSQKFDDAGIPDTPTLQFNQIKEGHFIFTFTTKLSKLNILEYGQKTKH